MRNNYVGDIGDYFKYSLLRALCPNLQLGILWYHYPDEENNGHGSKTAYLEQADLATYDPSLFEQLNQIVNIKQERTIQSIQDSSIFPPGTTYFDEPLSFQGISRKPVRKAYRQQWFQRAMNALASADIVFLDPDTGLEGSKNPYEHTEGPKYVAYDEVAALAQRGQSLVIYQHVRQIKPKDILTRRVEEIKSAAGYQGTVLSACLKAKNEADSRLFLILPAESHRVTLEAALLKFKAAQGLE